MSILNQYWRQGFSVTRGFNIKCKIILHNVTNRPIPSWRNVTKGRRKYKGINSVAREPARHAARDTASWVGALIKGERNGIKQTWTGVVLTGLSWLDLTGWETSGVEIKLLKITFCYTYDRWMFLLECNTRKPGW